MRTTGLVVLLATLLSHYQRLVKAEGRRGETLGSWDSLLEREPTLQRLSSTWTKQATLQEDLPSRDIQGQPLDHISEDEPGEAHRLKTRKARQLKGFSFSFGSSASSASSAVSSVSRSSSSVSSVGSSAGSYGGSSGASSLGSAASASRGVSAGSVQGAAGVQSVVPKASYVPPYHQGPTTTSASGALVVSNRLTAKSAPATGVSTALPRFGGPAKAGPYSRPTPVASRPYIHTYPAGYHLLYVPYYSSDYSGYHWAVYNDNNIFYSFDDGDTTPDDYDYEDHGEGRHLPAGCYYSRSNEHASLYEPYETRHTATAQPPASAGIYGSGQVSAPSPAQADAVLAAMAPGPASAPGAHAGRGSYLSGSRSYTAPAPAPHGSLRDARIASVIQDASLTSSGAEQSGSAGLLICSLVPARLDVTSANTSDTSAGDDQILVIVLSAVIPGTFVITMLAGLYFLIKKQKKPR